MKTIFCIDVSDAFPGRGRAGHGAAFEVFKSSSRSANVRQIHGRKGEVWTPESAADKIVVYRYQ